MFYPVMPCNYGLEVFFMYLITTRAGTFLLQIVLVYSFFFCLILILIDHCASHKYNLYTSGFPRQSLFLSRMQFTLQLNWCFCINSLSRYSFVALYFTSQWLLEKPWQLAITLDENTCQRHTVRESCTVQQVKRWFLLEMLGLVWGVSGLTYTISHFG